ncbi:methionine synthase reductase-like, partial [Centruroides sculpturatus]|uniref:methionine synthase reductase-like n=1 Tax=Centruroides sculpturatus TaxID=218467 RepID=UPI000C6E2FD7
VTPNENGRPVIDFGDKKKCQFSIKESNCVVIIVSTTGDGEPPQTVITFWRRIIKRTLPPDHLKGVYYTLLALGDSNYNSFCHFGKILDKRLEYLGAKRFYPTGYGDDAIGLEESVEPWIEGLWKAIRIHLNITIEIDYSSLTERIVIKNLSKNMDNNMAERNVNKVDDITNLSEKASNLKIDESSSKKSLLLRNSSVQADTLTIPLLPTSSLTVTYSSNKENIKKFSYSSSFLLSAVSDLIPATVISAKQLTFSSDVKTTLQLTVHIQDKSICYEPGDSFGFLCHNSPEEVEELLTRLKVTRYADVCCQLKFQTDKAKKTLAHLPECSTLREIFTNYCEIRAIPKKIFLRVLSEHTYDEVDKQRLNELCSKEGSSDYIRCVVQSHATLLDILEAFHSCLPPVEVVLENLPKLKPRFYSVASSPLLKPDQFNIVFNITEIEDGDKNMKGVCTGWLSKITNHMYNKQSLAHSKVLAGRTDKPLIRIYKKYNQRFHLTKDPSVPLIMIGPGSGIAPFIGFLHHRKYQIMNQLTEASHFGEAWLFYGCRYRDKDYLYKEELEKFQADGILTKLLVCFSRENTEDSFPDRPKYVQHNIIQYATDVVRLLKVGCVVYVCGDAKNMSQDVFKTFVEIWKTTE